MLFFMQYPKQMCWAFWKLQEKKSCIWNHMRSRIRCTRSALFRIKCRILKSNHVLRIESRVVDILRIAKWTSKFTECWFCHTSTLSSSFERSHQKESRIFFLIFKFPILFELRAVVMEWVGVYFFACTPTTTKNKPTKICHWKNQQINARRSTATSHPPPLPSETSQSPKCVACRLVMCRTKVLMYRTMVLLARLTKVRC